MKKLLLVLILMVPLSTMAQINECKTDIYFANGILTIEPSAKDNAYLLKQSVKKSFNSLNQYNKEIGKVDYAYNTTVGEKLDLWESAYQILDLQSYVDAGYAAIVEDKATIHEIDLSKQVTKYENSIKAGHKVLVVAHSQGNLFTYEAHKQLPEWMQTYFEAVSIASPDFTDVIKEGTPEIGWDNDVVALLGRGFFKSELTTCNVRQVKWEFQRDDIANNPPVAMPSDIYVYEPQVDTVFENLWKAKEDGMNSNVHAFTFYMGKNIKEGDDKKDNTGEKYLNPFDGKPLVDANARVLILKAISTQLKKLKQTPSQWKTDQEFKKYTKEHRITVKHIEEDSGLTIDEEVYPFNQDNGKLYQALDSEGTLSYVKASCNGTQIQETWDGQDTEKEFYKLKGTDPVEYIKGKACKDMSTMIPGGLFNAQLRWNEPLVEMSMTNSLMSESVNGCGISAIGSGDLSLYSVYPGTYPIGVSATGYESLVDKNISDTVTLNVRAVTASSKDSFTVTKAYQYAHLGKNGHLADILITRPDPKKPPVIEAIPTIPVESTNNNTYGSRPHTSPSISFSSNSHSYYGGKTTHVPSVHHMPPLCDESCGCLPCEYAILSYLNQARLGPISGAKVTLYKASEEDNPQRELLYEGSTSVSDKIDKAGVISLPIPYPEQKTLSTEEQAFMDSIADYDGDFILELSGGFDIDKDDDLVVDSTYTHLGGKLHLILDKKSLLNNDYKVNILTEIAYQLSKDLLGSSYDKKRVQERLDDIAKRVFIEKLYPVAEEPLGRLDLFYWIPSAHKNWLIKPYAKVAPIVEKVYKGEDIYDDAYRYVYEEIKQTQEQQSAPEPILASKWIKVSEGLKGAVDIGEVTLKSEGKSSIVSYHLSGEGSELFAIDEVGTISLKEGKTLDFEKKKLYQMSLTAKNSDGESRPVTLYVVVANVVDSPEDRSFEGGIFSEDTMPGEQVGFLHFDEGTSPIKRIEIAGADADAFEIALDGNITLSDMANFDYETKNYAQITLQAFNAEGKSRVVPIIFTITDAVDVPIVNTLDVHLREGAIARQVVGQMSILTNDPILDISLSGRGSENFEITKDGTVTVADGATIDYESVSNYVLKVQASNVQGMSREGMLVIRIDDAVDIPVLENTTLRIPEFSPIGTVVGKVSVKTSGSYQIDSFTLNDSTNFTIDDNGEITVANDMLSYTNQQYITLYATAINREGSSRRVSVVIYIDTKRPLLGVLDTYVYENSIAGTKIGKVPATNSALTIESVRIEGEGSENFTIDTNLDISVAEGALLDYERKTSYVLKVFATNSAGESDARSVYIRVIDRDDTIKIAGFTTTIYEDSKAGDTIGIVKVIAVGGLTIDHYTLSGEGSENFEITSSGIVTISDDATFDRKKHPNYHLLLTASDINAHTSNGAYLDISVVKSANTPVALSQNITLDEDSAKAIELIATDGDGDPLTYTIVTPPTNGVYEGGIYTPSANFNGRDEIVYKANDGKFDSDLATISITIKPVNDKPVVASQNITLDEDIATAIGLIATDVDGDTLVSTLVTAPLHGTYVNGTYTPSANYFGADKMIYKVNDGTIDSDLATISITINSINDIPVAFDQNITLDEDTSKTIKLSATDIERDALAYKVVNQPAHGTYAEGVYTPSANYHGVDSFTFVANDGQADSDLATVSITVNDINDAPTVEAGADANITVGYNYSPTPTISDIDGMIASTVWKEGNTILTFPKDDFSIGEHALTVMVTDDDGATAVDSLTLMVGKEANDFEDVNLTIRRTAPVYKIDWHTDEKFRNIIGSITTNKDDLIADAYSYKLDSSLFGIFKSREECLVDSFAINFVTRCVDRGLYLRKSLTTEPISPSYDFVVTATDEEGLKEKIKVHLDVLIVEGFTATVEDNTEGNRVIGSSYIGLFDDEKITVSLEGEGNEDFVIDENGVVSTAPDIRLDRNNISEYHLKVVANDIYKSPIDIIVSSRYARGENVEILSDSEVGIMWQDSIDSRSLDLAHDKAKKYCKESILGGYDDWRLPKSDELRSLIINNKIIKEMRNHAQAWYWTDLKEFVLNTEGGIQRSFLSDTNYFHCVRTDKFVTKYNIHKTDFTIKEEKEAGEAVVELDTSGIGDTIVEAVISGVDSRYFNLDTNGVITIKEGVVLNYKDKVNYVINVTLKTNYGFITKEVKINFDIIFNDNKTVYDPETQLSWQDDAYAKNISMNWQDSLDYCENLSLNNHFDWRLPSSDELGTIIAIGQRPAIKKEFKNVSGVYGYWSTTSYDEMRAEQLHFEVARDSGFAYALIDKLKMGSVRCVRDGQ
jgi:hypothetical protein